jgi:hypothetical protein
VNNHHTPLLARPQVANISRHSDNLIHSMFKGKPCPLFNFYLRFVTAKRLPAGDATLANTQQMASVSGATLLLALIT